MLTAKKVLVIGLARSGKAAALLLQRFKIQVVINVNGMLSDAEKQFVLDHQLEVVEGGHPDTLLDASFDFVVRNPGVPIHLKLVEDFIQQGVEVITEMELVYRLYPNQTYYAITGTNGKTTVTTLVYALIAKNQGENVLIGGNIGTPLCELALTHAFDKRQYTVIIEVAGFQLVGMPTFKPKVETILNLTPDHLDVFKNVAAYYASKQLIYKNMDISDTFIINIDDHDLRRSVLNKDMKMLSYSLHQVADIHVIDSVIYYKQAPIVALKDIKLKGEHNIYNIMAAIGFALEAKIPIATIKEVITHFKGVEHRIEYVATKQGAQYYNDSKATNTDAVIVALKSFEEPLIVLLGGKDKGLDFKDVLACGKNVRSWLLFGEATTVLSKVFKDAPCYNTLEEAVMAASKLAQKGMVVLLSPGCASYDAYTNYEARGDHFKQIVNKKV